MLIDDTLHRIRTFAASRGWSRNRLALAAGLTESTLRFLESPAWNPTAETLRRLEAVIPADFVPPPSPPSTSHPGAPV